MDFLNDYTVKHFFEWEELVNELYSGVGERLLTRIKIQDLKPVKYIESKDPPLPDGSRWRRGVFGGVYAEIF
ncbi:MAG: hypothetical protein LBD86_06110 [Spirochaetaceae bacterium]|jgi:hypothetical protein|nr:hypothetical protein [Spirochaetaceae bacterium]